MLQYIAIDHCRQFHRQSWGCGGPRNYSKDGMNNVYTGRSWSNHNDIEKIRPRIYPIWLRPITPFGWAFRRALWHHAHWYHARRTRPCKSTITTASYAAIIIPKISRNEQSPYGHKPILVQGGWRCVSERKWAMDVRMLTKDIHSVLGTSGQNIDDAFKYVDADTPLTLAERCMFWRHIAPSAPDTLCTYFLYRVWGLEKSSPLTYTFFSLSSRVLSLPRSRPLYCWTEPSCIFRW